MQHYWKMLLFCSLAILSNHVVFSRPTAKHFPGEIMTWSHGSAFPHQEFPSKSAKPGSSSSSEGTSDVMWTTYTYGVEGQGSSPKQDFTSKSEWTKSSSSEGASDASWTTYTYGLEEQGGNEGASIGSWGGDKHKSEQHSEDWSFYGENEEQKHEKHHGLGSGHKKQKDHKESGHNKTHKESDHHKTHKESGHDAHGKKGHMGRMLGDGSFSGEGLGLGGGLAGMLSGSAVGGLEFSSFGEGAMGGVVEGSFLKEVADESGIVTGIVSENFVGEVAMEAIGDGLGGGAIEKVLESKIVVEELADGLVVNNLEGFVTESGTQENLSGDGMAINLEMIEGLVDGNQLLSGESEQFSQVDGVFNRVVPSTDNILGAYDISDNVLPMTQGLPYPEGVGNIIDIGGLLPSTDMFGEGLPLTGPVSDGALPMASVVSDVIEGVLTVTEIGDVLSGSQLDNALGDLSNFLPLTKIATNEVMPALSNALSELPLTNVLQGLPGEQLMDSIATVLANGISSALPLDMLADGPMEMVTGLLSGHGQLATVKDLLNGEGGPMNILSNILGGKDGALGILNSLSDGDGPLEKLTSVMNILDGDTVGNLLGTFTGLVGELRISLPSVQVKPMKGKLGAEVYVTAEILLGGEDSPVGDLTNVGLIVEFMVTICLEQAPTPQLVVDSCKKIFAGIKLYGMVLDMAGSMVADMLPSLVCPLFETAVGVLSIAASMAGGLVPPGLLGTEGELEDVLLEDAIGTTGDISDSFDNFTSELGEFNNMYGVTSDGLNSDDLQESFDYVWSENRIYEEEIGNVGELFETESIGEQSEVVALDEIYNAEGTNAEEYDVFIITELEDTVVDLTENIVDEFQFQDIINPVQDDILSSEMAGEVFEYDKVDQTDSLEVMFDTLSNELEMSSDSFVETYVDIFEYTAEKTEGDYANEVTDVAVVVVEEGIGTSEDMVSFGSIEIEDQSSTESSEGYDKDSVIFSAVETQDAVAMTGDANYSEDIIRSSKYESYVVGGNSAMTGGVVSGGDSIALGEFGMGGVDSMTGGSEYGDSITITVIETEGAGGMTGGKGYGGSTSQYNSGSVKGENFGFEMQSIEGAKSLGGGMNSWGSKSFFNPSPFQQQWSFEKVMEMPGEHSKGGTFAWTKEASPKEWSKTYIKTVEHQ